MPYHSEEARRCPDTGGTVVDDGGSGGGAKGLTRKACQEEGAKGIFRKECEEVVRADCQEYGAKGIYRTECEELRKKDCRDAAAKGIHRSGCEEEVVVGACAQEERALNDCDYSGPDCSQQRKALTDCVCKAQIGPDPEVEVPQLVAALDQCLATRASLDWYVSPQVLVSSGATAFHEEGTRAITHDPAALGGMSLYDKSFHLAYAFAAYVMDLEQQRLGTVRPASQRANFTHEIAGFLAHCLESRDLYPNQVTMCPDARNAHQAFLASGSRGITRPGSDGTTTAHDEWVHGWFGYGAGLPAELRHEPDRGVIEAAQAALDRLGYDPGGIDGFMGPRTAAAVMAFEQDNGLEQTGVLYEKVLSLLQLQ
jgi:hypothetical protein